MLAKARQAHGSKLPPHLRRPVVHNRGQRQTEPRLFLLSRRALLGQDAGRKGTHRCATPVLALSCLLPLLYSVGRVALGAELIVRSQVVEPYKANGFLVYVSTTKEAALFDAPGPIDSLMQTIKEKGLDVKYIFITHAHCDHIFGLPALIEAFPSAKICISKEEYEDNQTLYLKWADWLDPKMVAEIRSDPEMVRMMNFDLKSIAQPVVSVKDGDVFRLADTLVRAYMAPGHSRGSICYQADKALFSGDVVFYRNVGRSDMPGSGALGSTREIRPASRLG